MPDRDDNSKWRLFLFCSVVCTLFAAAFLVVDGPGWVMPLMMALAFVNAIAAAYEGGKL